MIDDRHKDVRREVGLRRPSQSPKTWDLIKPKEKSINLNRLLVHITLYLFLGLPFSPQSSLSLSSAAVFNRSEEQQRDRWDGFHAPGNRRGRKAARTSQ